MPQDPDAARQEAQRHGERVACLIAAFGAAGLLYAVLAMLTHV